MLDLLLAQATDPASGFGFSVMDVLASPLSVAAAAMVGTQLVKENTKLAGRWAISLVNVGIVAVLALLALALGQTWMRGETLGAVLIALVNVVATSLMSSGIWAMLLQGQEDEAPGPVKPPLAPMLALALLLGAAMTLGGCQAPGNAGEQLLLRDKAELSAAQARKVEAMPYPPTFEQWQTVQLLLRKSAVWDQGVLDWSRGGAPLVPAKLPKLE